MKIAIIGSRTVTVNNMGDYLPDGCDEIVSGGAAGIDTCAAEYAVQNGIKLTVFKPEYSKYGRAAPIVRNKQIVDYSDIVIAFWDGKSRGTKSVIDYCEKTGKPCKIVLSEQDVLA
ncbi:MAG: hypothetical protein IJX74_03370 [Clostridia bacterium]|nr:hypothetical protein [Clostridia bacterium]